MPDKKREIVKVEIPSKAIRVQHATCPHGHNLMDSEHKINGYPSVAVLARYKDKQGLIYLDPIYGSFKNAMEIDVPEGECVEFYCPTCKEPLTLTRQICDQCGANMFEIRLPHHGLVAGCLRNGCHFHTLKLADGENLLRSLEEDHTLDSFL